MYYIYDSINSIEFTELRDEGIGDFLKLHKLAKKEGISVELVLSLLQLAYDDNTFGLSSIEIECEWLIDKIHDLNMQLERARGIYSH
jgi:hypothetical protein